MPPPAEHAAVRLRALAFAVFALLACASAGTASPSALSLEQALKLVARDDEDARGCTRNDAASMRAGTSVRDLAREPRLALVEVQSSCVCGAQNCPFWVYRLEGNGGRLVLSGFAIGIKTIPAASAGAPPDVVATAHDSALVSDETRFAYRGGKYAPAGSWRVRNDTGERRPLAIEIRFAPGSSSARLRGTTALGWEDAYAFSAAAGQRLTIAGATPSGLDLELISDGKAPVRIESGGAATILAAGGRYRLTVGPNADAPEAGVPYAFTLAIR